MFPNSEHLNEKYPYCVCGADTIFFKIIDDNLVEIITISKKARLEISSLTYIF